jgi:hypothetical protein
MQMIPDAAAILPQGFMDGRGEAERGGIMPTQKRHDFLIHALKIHHDAAFFKQPGENIVIVCSFYSLRGSMGCLVSRNDDTNVWP